MTAGEGPRSNAKMKFHLDTSDRDVGHKVFVKIECSACKSLKHLNVLAVEQQTTTNRVSAADEKAACVVHPFSELKKRSCYSQL